MRDQARPSSLTESYRVGPEGKAALHIFAPTLGGQSQKPGLWRDPEGTPNSA